MESKELNCKWHFAEVMGGIDQGPNEAMGQTFKKAPYNTLVRESIQNSLDASINNEPVVVEIKFRKISSEVLRNFRNDLRKHIQGGLKYTDDPELALEKRWKRTKVLIHTIPQTDKLDNIDKYNSVAIGLNFDELSMKTLKEVSNAKYVLVVSQHVPEYKRAYLYKVEGAAELVHTVDDSCLSRFVEAKDPSSHTYVKFRLKDANTALRWPIIDLAAVHKVQGGSHSPRVVSMSDIIKVSDSFNLSESAISHTPAVKIEIHNHIDHADISGVQGDIHIDQGDANIQNYNEK